MKKQRQPKTAVRKAPKQERSKELVTAILQAAIRVLQREGAARFTTVRVAEQAGVSVGSLYQYFPNKESILFRLQVEEWQQTGTVLETILDDRSKKPLARLREMVIAFFRSERDEAQLRVALGDAAPLYRQEPENRVHRERGTRRMAAFMKEALPNVSARRRALAADVVMTAMSATGKALSEQARPREEHESLARETASMLCAYVELTRRNE